MMPSVLPARRAVMMALPATATIPVKSDPPRLAKVASNGLAPGCRMLGAMKQALLLALCSTFLLFAAHAKDKKPIEWHTGTLLDSTTERGTRLIANKDRAYEVRRDNSFYEIDDGEKYIYVVRRSMTSRRDKPIRLTVNGPVRFALAGDDILLLDENGKQHRLAIEKKILKNP